jgi:hypothetical protein
MWGILGLVLVLPQTPGTQCGGGVRGREGGREGGRDGWREGRRETFEAVPISMTAADLVNHAPSALSDIGCVLSAYRERDLVQDDNTTKKTANEK